VRSDIDHGEQIGSEHGLIGVIHGELGGQVHASPQSAIELAESFEGAALGKTMGITFRGLGSW
jgi:hypothetical protein